MSRTLAVLAATLGLVGAVATTAPAAVVSEKQVDHYQLLGKTRTGASKCRHLLYHSKRVAERTRTVTPADPNQRWLIEEGYLQTRDWTWTYAVRGQRCTKKQGRRSIDRRKETLRTRYMLVLDTARLSSPRDVLTVVGPAPSNSSSTSTNTSTTVTNTTDDRDTRNSNAPCTATQTATPNTQPTQLCSNGQLIVVNTDCSVAANGTQSITAGNPFGEPTEPTAGTPPPVQIGAFPICTVIINPPVGMSPGSGGVG
jgi:hypothetical protein